MEFIFHKLLSETNNDVCQQVLEPLGHNYGNKETKDNIIKVLMVQIILAETWMYHLCT